MFLWFEDMKKDQRKVIEDLSVFLKHPLTASQTDSLVDHLKFENMKANPNANPMAGMEMESAGNFFRKGEVKSFQSKLKTNKEARFRNSSGIELLEEDPSMLICKCSIAAALKVHGQFQVGNWKKFFTPEKAEEWASWIEQKTNGTGLSEKIPPF